MVSPSDISGLSLSVYGRNPKLTLLLCAVFSLLAGALGGIATQSSVRDWYLELNKPFFNPPSYLFGPVWTALYLLMGWGWSRILIKTGHLRNRANLIFLLQWLLNVAWSFLFFGLKAPLPALIEILLLWCLILWMIVQWKPIDKIAAFAQLPYLAWVSFATVLNASLYWLNR